MTRTAVVTGVTSGIGQAVTERLLAAGSEVIGIARHEERLAEAARAWGPRFVPLRADLAIAPDRARAAERLRQLDRPIDVYVGNAAECVYQSPLTVSAEQLGRLFEINVVAALELAQAIVPLMRRGGHIVQISSVTARHLPGPGFAPYAATKLALERLTEALRLELHPRGIRVSLVSPGLVDTPLYEKVAGFERARAKIVEQLPVSAWLRADDVAESILWVLDRPARVAVSELVILPAGQTR
jgi:NAD(P)-dependent dehydrogenase (short-subunit alcohol dehydrogenase family)